MKFFCLQHLESSQADDETFEEMVCDECMKNNPFLRNYSELCQGEGCFVIHVQSWWALRSFLTILLVIVVCYVRQFLFCISIYENLLRYSFVSLFSSLYFPASRSKTVVRILSSNDNAHVDVVNDDLTSTDSTPALDAAGDGFMSSPAVAADGSKSNVLDHSSLRETDSVPSCLPTDVSTDNSTQCCLPSRREDDAKSGAVYWCEAWRKHLCTCPKCIVSLQLW